MATARAKGRQSRNSVVLLRKSKITTLQVHHTFLQFSLPSLYDYDVKMPIFTCCGAREYRTTFFFFS